MTIWKKASEWPPGKYWTINMRFAARCQICCCFLIFYWIIICWIPVLPLKTMSFHVPSDGARYATLTREKKVEISQSKTNSCSRRVSHLFSSFHFVTRCSSHHVLGGSWWGWRWQWPCHSLWCLHCLRYHVASCCWSHCCSSARQRNGLYFGKGSFPRKKKKNHHLSCARRVSSFSSFH